MNFVANFLKNTTVKEFWESANICQSYERMYSSIVFLTHCVYLYEKGMIVKNRISPEDPLNRSLPNFAQRVTSPTLSPWEFFGNRLRGFDSVRGRILPFSYLQVVAINTVLVLPCSLWKKQVTNHKLKFKSNAITLANPVSLKVDNVSPQISINLGESIYQRLNSEHAQNNNKLCTNTHPVL